MLLERRALHSLQPWLSHSVLSMLHFPFKNLLSGSIKWIYSPTSAEEVPEEHSGATSSQVPV